MTPDYLYRCEIFTNAYGNHQLIVEQYKVLKETPKGYQLNLYGYGDYIKKRFVLKEGTKAFARTTVQRAFIDLYHRNLSHIKKLEARLEIAKQDRNSIKFVAAKSGFHPAKDFMPDPEFEAALLSDCSLSC